VNLKPFPDYTGQHVEISVEEQPAFLSKVKFCRTLQECVKVCTFGVPHNWEGFPVFQSFCILITCLVPRSVPIISVAH